MNVLDERLDDPWIYFTYRVVGLLLMIGCAALIAGWAGVGIVVGWFLYRCGVPK